MGKIISCLLMGLVVISISGCAIFDDSINAVKGEIDYKISETQDQLNNKIDATKSELTYSAKGYVDKATASVISSPQTTVNLFLDYMMNGEMEDALSLCAPDSQAYESMLTFQDDYFVLMFASFMFQNQEYYNAAISNEKLHSVCAAAADKICKQYEIIEESEIDNSLSEYTAIVTVNTFQFEDHISSAIDKMIATLEEEEGVEELKDLFNENGADEAALKPVAEKFIFDHMDTLLDAVEYSINNTYNYSDTYTYISVKKINGKWYIYEIE